MSRLLTQAPQVAGELPFVSVVCPTWQRRAFLPYLIYMFQYQDYPADRRELVILDDSPASSRDLIERLVAVSGADPESVRYYHVEERMSIGRKRNRLNELARGTYIVCMDDDDYYPPDKISHAVDSMQQRAATFSGSDRIYIWYSHIDKIYRTHAFGDRHALNGTFAYHRNYLKAHRYDDRAVLAEERGFMNGFTVPVLQIDPKRSILCISHSANTFDKDFILASCERTELTLEDFVTDSHLLRHYRRLSHAPLDAAVDWHRFDRIVVNSAVGAKAGLAEFRASLIALGASPERIVEFESASHDGQDTESHLAVARMAREAGWKNYLLLDSRVQFVRQEKAVANVNRFLKALERLQWEVAILGADVRSGVPLQSLPGAQKVCLAGEAVAYAVNGSYYDAFGTNLERILAEAGGREHLGARIDHAWLPMMQEGRWLALYPSFAYLGLREDGVDLTPGFFRKLHESGGEHDSMTQST
ncbi:glycosyl transferase family A [Burkholderia territorii]|nr:glycosyl transferase family A [Burkholderia territorii]